MLAHHESILIGIATGRVSWRSGPRGHSWWVGGRPLDHVELLELLMVVLLVVSGSGDSLSDDLFLLSHFLAVLLLAFVSIMSSSSSFDDEDDNCDDDNKEGLQELKQSANLDLID